MNIKITWLSFSLVAFVSNQLSFKMFKVITIFLCAIIATTHGEDEKFSLKGKSKIRLINVVKM